MQWEYGKSYNSGEIVSYNNVNYRALQLTPSNQTPSPGIYWKVVGATTSADSAAYPNTYIGMRYVPLMAGSWDTTMQTEYEPLTVVEYQGNSYTSRTFVPKNINITNTEYWVLTGNYNAQVEQYRQEVQAFDGRITQNTNDIAELEPMIRNNTISINVLNSDVSALQQSAIYVGNSYTQGIGSTGGTNGIYNQTKYLFKKSFMTYGDGIGFLPYSGHTNTFRSQLTALVNTLSADDKNSITTLFFISAWGDTRAYAQIGTSWTGQMQTELSNLKAYISNELPNVKNIYVTLAEGRGTRNITGNPYHSCWRLNNSFYGLCKNNGMTYMGWIGWEIMGDPACFSSDLYHPNDAGYQMLSQAFINVLNGVYTPRRRWYFNNNISFFGNDAITGAVQYWAYPWGTILNLPSYEITATEEILIPFGTGSTVTVFTYPSTDIFIPYMGDSRIGTMEAFFTTNSARQSVLMTPRPTESDSFSVLMQESKTITIPAGTHRNSFVGGIIPMITAANTIYI